GWTTLRKPKDIVTTSKDSSAKGRRVASAAEKSSAGRCCNPCRSIPREKSAETTSAPAPRRGTEEDPGPAAMSRIRSPGRGSIARTTLRRHRRVCPSDMTSFIRSYFAAVSSNIAATSLGSFWREARLMSSSSHPQSYPVHAMTSPSPVDQPPVGDPGDTLLARTVAVPLPRVEDLLALLPEPEDVGDVVSWVRRGEGLVGWGRVATFTSSGPDRFAEAQQWWRRTTAEAIVRDDVQEPGTGPIAFGSMAFSRHSDSDSVLVVPEVVVGRRGSHAWITTITRASTVPPA